jgi:hypothetical protein
MDRIASGASIGDPGAPRYAHRSRRVIAPGVVEGIVAFIGFEDTPGQREPLSSGGWPS